MLQQKIRFKSKDDMRYTILPFDMSRDQEKGIAFIVCEDNNLRKELFNVIITVNRLVLMRVGHQIVPVVDKFIKTHGLKLIKEKINEKDFQSQEIAFTDSDLEDIDTKIEAINKSGDIYRERKRVQRDILASLYKQENLGATPWQLMNLVWCDSQILIQELFYFDRQEFISAPAIRHEKFDDEEEEQDEQKRQNRMIYLKELGKREFEKLMDDEQGISSNDVFIGWVPFASNNKVFLAHRFAEVDLIKKIKKKLRDVGLDYTEGRLEDLGYISEDIIYKIKNSGFFFALITPQSEYRNGMFSTSSWILMEMGVAKGFGRKVALLVEDVIDSSDYDGKLQGDCQYETFNRSSNFDDKLEVIIGRIKNERDKYTKK